MYVQTMQMPKMVRVCFFGYFEVQLRSVTGLWRVPVEEPTRLLVVLRWRDCGVEVYEIH